MDEGREAKVQPGLVEDEVADPLVAGVGVGEEDGGHEHGHDGRLGGPGEELAEHRHGVRAAADAELRLLP